jgi:NitT/TauT family transport system permease protein
VTGARVELLPVAQRGVRPLTGLRLSKGSSALGWGIVGILGFIAVWELATRSSTWFGWTPPIVGKLPAPDQVAHSFASLAGSGGFWDSCRQSFERVILGFVAALLVGVPFGLLMATRQRAKAVLFAPFEILRPIPPLAWVPLSILFWPTQTLSIEFVIFLGAFYPIVLNIVGGAEQIDRRHILAARSLGAGNWTLFRRVVLPATLPSIATGAVVGMGITWEVVVAAELISGGGQTSTGGGLGFLLWNSYQGDQIPQVVVCMISLGIAGFVSSAAMRALSTRLMPWRRSR